MRPARAAVTATLIASALAACGAPSTDVADVSLVTVLPKEVGPGGFQSTLEDGGIATGFFYQAVISDCGAAVVAATREWAAQHQFAAEGGEVEERLASLRLSSDELPGAALVVRYSLSSDHSLARLRIGHEGGEEGSTQVPEKLRALGVQELLEAQLAAARCTVGA